MMGEKTAIILGAGASYCYSGGQSGIPIQQNIIGKLFFEASASGEGMPSLAVDSGLMHSFRLAKYLRARFEIPEGPDKKLGKIDFWTALQDKGYDLESLYAVLEDELEGESRVLLEDFVSIIRTAVSGPVGERGAESVCRHHKRLCEALEPGDYIINFNWDSVMADTLLLHSHLWFPRTGFGLSNIGALLPPCQKDLAVESMVQLLHIHGSVVLYEYLDDENPAKRLLLYTGPRQWSPANGWLSLHGKSLDDMKPGGGSFSGRPEVKELEERITSHGYIYLDGKWFRPMFVPPSRAKPQYEHWYLSRLRAVIHANLPSTRQFIVAGYSFPEADLDYLGRIFVPAVLNPSSKVRVVNPSNENSEFQQRVEATFRGLGKVSFEESDFREFCANLEVDTPDRESLGPGRKREKKEGEAMLRSLTASGDPSQAQRNIGGEE